MECEHQYTIIKKITKTVGKQIFKSKAKTCKECGAVCWDNEIQAKFNEWLINLAHTKNSCFMVQEIKLPSDIIDFLNKKSLEFSAKENKSAIIKAMVSIWCNFVDKNDTLIEAIENEYIMNSKVLSHINMRENIKLNPKFYIRVKAQADLVDMSMQEFISACVIRVSFAIMNETENKFYDIRDKIQEILEVA